MSDYIDRVLEGGERVVGQVSQLAVAAPVEEIDVQAPAEAAPVARGFEPPGAVSSVPTQVARQSAESPVEPPPARAPLPASEAAAFETAVHMEGHGPVGETRRGSPLAEAQIESAGEFRRDTPFPALTDPWREIAQPAQPQRGNQPRSSWSKVWIEAPEAAPATPAAHRAMVAPALPEGRQPQSERAMEVLEQPPNAPRRDSPPIVVAPSKPSSVMTLSSANESLTPRKDGAPEQAANGLVIHNLEVRVVTPAQEERAPSAAQSPPARQPTAAGAWVSPARRYLGRA